MFEEAASALGKRAMVRKELSANQATFIYRDWLTLPLSLRASAPVADAALRAALKYNHSVYDALYGALAIAHRCDFVTADRALANKLQGVFPFIVHLSAIKP